MLARALPQPVRALGPAQGVMRGAFLFRRALLHERRNKAAPTKVSFGSALTLRPPAQARLFAPPLSQLARGFFCFTKTLLTDCGFPAAHLSADVVPTDNRQRDSV